MNMDITIIVFIRAFRLDVRCVFAWCVLPQSVFILLVSEDTHTHTQGACSYGVDDGMVAALAA